MKPELKSMKFTLRPSKFDNRDFIYKSKPKEKVDLREWDSPVENQSFLGSCVGNAIANAYESMLKRLYPEKFEELSRLFIYYNARYIEGTTTIDIGSYIRSGLQGVKTYGVCKESIWPYDVTKFDDAPSPEAYLDAGHRKISNYYRLLTCDDAVQSLEDEVPVVVGMNIYDNFLMLDKENPNLKMPSMENTPLGGHAVCLVGYDLTTDMFLAKNSFGTEWGLNGYFWMPFDYVEYYAWELWNFDIYVD